MNKNICVITGSRAEFSLLSGLIKKIDQEECFTLQVIACNMHLSPEFGNTISEIENEGIKVNKKVEMLLSSDTEIGTCKSTGLGLIGFADAYSELNPDLVVVLGDRYEILAAATAAMFFKIPIAHISGGEITEGAYDDSIRHAVTKMSRLHFTSHEIYRNRVIQMGEDPKHVFNVGSLSIDNIKNTELLTKEQFEKSIDFKLAKSNVLVTYHPETGKKNTNQADVLKDLLKVLDELTDTNIIFTLPNSDDRSREIISLIKSFVSENLHKSKAFISLGYKRYLSALKHVNVVVGNSSSGIVEVPSFKIGTINIGNRQKGRIRTNSIIDCDGNYTSIKNAFKNLQSTNFKKELIKTTNPFGEGYSSEKIINFLKKVNFSELLSNKKFFFH